MSGNKESVSGKDTLRMPARETAERPKSRIEIDPKILEAIKNETDGNKYYFDKSNQPDDMTYEFKRLSYGGMEDKPYQMELKRKGWTAVPLSRHPECGTEDPEMKHVIIGGQILMERHVEYTKLAHKINKENSDKLVTGQFERLQLSSNEHMPRKLTKANITYEPGQPVPE